MSRKQARKKAVSGQLAESETHRQVPKNHRIQSDRKFVKETLTSSLIESTQTNRIR